MFLLGVSAGVMVFWRGFGVCVAGERCLVFVYVVIHDGVVMF